MKIRPATSQWFDEQGIRLDASYHLSEARQAKFSIDKSPLGTKTLSEVTERIFLGGRFRRVYVSDSERGYPYLTASDMTKAEPFSATYLSKTYTKNQEKLMIRKGWILLSCSGSIGRTVFTNELFEGQIGTHDLIRIVPDHEALPAGYLYAFLSSKYGYSLLTQGTYGGVIQHIEPHHIKDLPIPLLPEAEQAAIHAMIEEAAQLRVEANRLLEEAVKEIENKLPQLNFKNIYATSVSVFSNQKNRLDATAQLKAITEFYESINNLENVELKSIGELSDKVFTPNIFKRLRVTNPANGIAFLSGTNLLEARPKFDSLLSRKMPKIEDYVLKEGWVTIQDAGTIGFINLIPKFLEGVAATNNLVRILPSQSANFNPYIYAFLKTDQGLSILKSRAFGSVQLHLDNNQITDLLIPIFDDIVEQVTVKVLAFNSKFNRANELETAAIAQVEAWIEAW